MRIIPKARGIKEMSIAEPNNSFDTSFMKRKGTIGLENLRGESE